MPKFTITELAEYEVEAPTAQEAMERFLSNPARHDAAAERHIYDENGVLCDEP